MQGSGKGVWVAIATLGLVGVSFAGEVESKVCQGTLNVDYVTKYVWRGLNLVHSSVLQPSVNLSYRGFKALFWGNLELTNHNSYPFAPSPGGKFTEWDTSLAYTHACGPVEVTVGAVDYQFPYQAVPRTQEVWATVEWSGFVDAVLTGYYDVGVVHGVYGTLGVSKDVVKVEGHPVTLSAQVGYGDKKHNAYYYGLDKATFTDALFGVSTTIEVGKVLSFTPYLRYATLLDNQILSGEPRRDNWIGGLCVGYKF